MIRFAASFQPKLNELHKNLQNQQKSSKYADFLVIFRIFFKFGWKLAAKQIMVVILRSFRFFWHPWHPWGRLSSGLNNLSSRNPSVEQLNIVHDLVVNIWFIKGVLSILYTVYFLGSACSVQSTYSRQFRRFLYSLKRKAMMMAPATILLPHV